MFSETDRETEGGAEHAWEVEVFDANGALTAEFLRLRGSCCGYGCKNCPYDSGAVPAQ